VVTERCPPLVYLDHAVSGPYTGEVGTAVMFRCRRGHRFRDGTTEKSVRCGDNREWEEIEDCKGSCLVQGNVTKLFYYTNFDVVEILDINYL